MAQTRTGAERYLEARLADPQYRVAYERARRRIDRIDRIIRALDARRVELALTKAELARRADIPPDAIRRLFSAGHPNPRLSTLVAIADALDVDLIAPAERTRTRTSSQVPSGASRTRRRTA